MKTKQAFTLAEVLITLAIIGIIAAITIPSTIANHQKRTLETQFAKAYRTLSAAVQMAISENGGLVGWEWKTSYSSDDSDNFFKTNFADYLNIVKFCSAKDAQKAECFPDLTYKHLNGSDYSNFKTWGSPKMIFADGSIALFIMGVNNGSFNYPSITFLVDVNGFKKPNMVGRDLFQFLYYPETGEFLPRGVYKWNEIDEETGEYKKNTYEQLLELCNPNQTGFSCAARVVADGFKINY